MAGSRPLSANVAPDMSSLPQGATEPVAPLETARPEPDNRLSLLRRGLLGVSGLLLLVGFFLPWLKVGSLLTVSGFGLVFASGDVVSFVSGTSRFMLILVPLLGALLLGGAIWGHRIAQWVALAGATLILGFGLINLIQMLLASTGLGMWLVTGAAITSLVVSLLGTGARDR
jgi:hypothetical protein